MKTKIKLKVTDCDYVMTLPLYRTLEKIASVRRNWRTYGTRDWRAIASRYIRKLYPDAFVYRGGHHIAIHEMRDDVVGECFGRICES